MHGQRLAYCPQQALGATGAGDDAEVDFRLAETGVAAGDDDVGTHHQFAAATQGVAVDGGDQWLGEGGDALPVGHPGVVEDADQVALGHLADIGACGECLAAAGDDHRAGLFVLPGRFQRSGQLCQ